MIVFIPMADGQFLSYSVLDSIVKQNMVCELIPVTTPGVLKSNHTVLNEADRVKKIVCEVNSRNKLLDILKLYPQVKYFAVQDRDIIHKESTNINRCIELMDTIPGIAALSLPLFPYDNTVGENHPMYNHVRLAAFVGRTDFFIEKGIRFRYNQDYHICPCFKEDIEKAGGRFEYYGNIPLIEELK